MKAPTLKLLCAFLISGLLHFGCARAPDTQGSEAGGGQDTRGSAGVAEHEGTMSQIGQRREEAERATVEKVTTPHACDTVGESPIQSDSALEPVGLVPLTGPSRESENAQGDEIGASCAKSPGEKKASDSGMLAAVREENNRSFAFRRSGGSNTLYFIFRSDGTYSFWAREHLFSMELESGLWMQDSDGQITLTCERGEPAGTQQHLMPIAYRSFVALTSSDHDLVSIGAATAVQVRKKLDGLQPGSRLFHLHLFLAVDARAAEEEWRTPQPFMIHPEFARRSIHPVFKAGTAKEVNGNPQTLPAGGGDAENGTE